MDEKQCPLGKTCGDCKWSIIVEVVGAEGKPEGKRQQCATVFIADRMARLAQMFEHNFIQMQRQQRSGLVMAKPHIKIQ